MSTITAPRPIELDPGRIAAGAGAIALNVALLMLLLVPIGAPPVIERTEAIVPDFILIRPKPTPPVPEDEPEEVEVTKPTTRPVEQVRDVPQPPQPPQATTDEAQPGDVVVPPDESLRTDTPPGPAIPDDGEPMQGAHLEYASAPPPPYPRDALRDGLTGTVMLQVLVDVDGRPLEVTVARSSGHRALDLAARRQVLAHWTFRPAVRGGRAVRAIGRVPVVFELD